MKKKRKEEGIRKLFSGTVDRDQREVDDFNPVQCWKLI